MANVFRRPRRGKARIVPKSQWFKGGHQSAFTRNRLAGNKLAGGVISRNFTTLVAAGNKNFTFSAVSLTGDYKIELDVELPPSAPTSNQAVIGDTGGAWAIYISTGGGVVTQYPTAAGQYLYLTVTPTLGKLSHITLERVGNDVTLTVDGVTDTVPRADWQTISPSRIGSVGTWLYYDGIIADVEIANAGAMNRAYGINETWDGPSTVLIDYGSDGSDGTAVNITSVDSENFTFDGSVSPNTWTNDTETIVIEVAGT